MLKYARISFGYLPTETPEPVLTSIENEAVNAICSILEKGGIDRSILFFDKTKEYIKITARIQLQFHHELTFCRLKFAGFAYYMELTINGNDAKLLKNDPRFVGLELGKKRFSRIPVDSVSSIYKYSDVILNAYKWGISIKE